MNKKPYIQQPSLRVVELQSQYHLLSGSQQAGPSANFMSNPGIVDEE